MMMMIVILLARVVDLVVVAVPVVTLPRPLTTVIVVLAVMMMMTMTPVVLALWFLVSARCSLPGLFFLPVRPCESDIDGHGCDAARLLLDSGILSYTNHLC